VTVITDGGATCENNRRWVEGSPVLGGLSD